MALYGGAAKIFALANRKALVVGGTRGLGREMALCLLENGCDVAVTSRNAFECQDMLAHADRLGQKAFLHACDVTRTADVARMVESVKADLGRIDILVHSAGTNIIRPMTEMDDESWDTVMNLNLRSVFLVMREVGKIMKQQHYGKIINISSMKGFLGTSGLGYSAYCASKGGLNMLTKQAACELAADGITVNAIAPTFIKTEINADLLDDPQFRAALEARIPVGRIGEFTDMMGLLLLLASDASQFITGQVMLLDGGIYARQ